jgi:sugar/nucleoside kinase (ribokinase family)
MEKYDFVAIGDITTDAFIRLEEKSAHYHLDRGNLEICVNFGDKIPYEFVVETPAVGNSANASVCASRLGLKSALITDLGGDENGKKCIESLKNNNVDTKYLSVHEDKKTNYHYVLWYEDDRTILVKHEKYDRKIKEFPKTKWVYLSSLGRDAEKYQEEIMGHLESDKEIKLAFQPGTFQMELGVEKLKKIYERSDLLALNKNEAGRILKTEEKDSRKLVELLLALGPKMILMTDGKNGAYFYDGKEFIFEPPCPDLKPPYERTGAGDAYSSTFLSFIILGKDYREALRLASKNALSVIQKIGPQEGLLNQENIYKTIC